MKIKAPAPFDGNQTKLNTFLNKYDLYMVYYKHKDNWDKIFFILYNQRIQMDWRMRVMPTNESQHTPYCTWYHAY